MCVRRWLLYTNISVTVPYNSYTVASPLKYLYFNFKCITGQTDGSCKVYIFPEEGTAHVLMKNFLFPLCFEKFKSDMDQVTRHNEGITYSRPQALSGGSSLWNRKHIPRTVQVGNYKTSNSVLKDRFYPFKPCPRLHEVACTVLYRRFFVHSHRFLFIKWRFYSVCGVVWVGCFVPAVHRGKWACDSNEHSMSARCQTLGQPPPCFFSPPNCWDNCSHSNG